LDDEKRLEIRLAPENHLPTPSQNIGKRCPIEIPLEFDLVAGWVKLNAMGGKG
jgi:hypothetical protein